MIEFVLGFFGVVFLLLLLDLIAYTLVKRAGRGKYCPDGEQHEFTSFTCYNVMTWGTDKQERLIYCADCGYRKE